MKTASAFVSCASGWPLTVTAMRSNPNANPAPADAVVEAAIMKITLHYPLTDNGYHEKVAK